MKNIINKIKALFTIKMAVLIAIGIILGWLFFGRNTNKYNIENTKSRSHNLDSHTPVSQWTCSMHPYIKTDTPGSCPICGMDLIPLEKEENDDEIKDTDIYLSKNAMKIAEVNTSVVQRIIPYKEIYIQGTVRHDERSVSNITARFPGRIEKLTVNFTGQKVKKGEILAKIYSPELVSAQKELFEAIKFKKTSPKFYEAARNKLKLLSLFENQIDQIESTGNLQYQLEILSPQSGTVMQKNIVLGDYVKEGTPLFEIMDLSRVWVMFDAYESDLPWMKVGSKIEFIVKSIPSKTFKGHVTFIDPVINPRTRVTHLRLEINNQLGLLKPGMFAKGILKSKLSKNKKALIVPKTAILWTGKRAVVYVKKSNITKDLFSYREIELGEATENYYIVSSGLEEGEEIATNGVFKIDAAAQLLGKYSMMNPKPNKKEAENENSIKKEVSRSKKFQKQFQTAYQKYLILKEAFVTTNASMIKSAAKEMYTAIIKTDMKLLKGSAHISWMKYLNVINTNISAIYQSDDIISQRNSFIALSNAMYKPVKEFGVFEKVYYQFCPMADNNKGAYWLSNKEEIKNPYFGNMMLKCGMIKEIIEIN